MVDRKAVHLVEKTVDPKEPYLAVQKVEHLEQKKVDYLEPY